MPRGGRARRGEGGTTNICMLTAHRQTHKETHRKCIESHGLSAFGFALCFCFISFTTFVAVVSFVVVCFGFLCLTGLAFESLSKAHLAVQCECTHECFSEAPSPSSSTLPSLLFNVY